MCMCKTYRNRNKVLAIPPQLEGNLQNEIWFAPPMTSHKKNKDVEGNEGNILEVQKRTS